MRNLGLLALVGLVVYCLVDITRSDDDERAGVHAALWMALVVLLPVLGSIVWLVVSRSRRSRREQGGGGGRPASPDDDPDFLRRLSQQQRRRDADLGTPPATSDDPPTQDDPPLPREP